MRPNRSYEIVQMDRENNTITMFDRETSEITSVQPLPGTSLFDAYEAWQQGRHPDRSLMVDFKEEEDDEDV